MQWNNGPYSTGNKANPSTLKPAIQTWLASEDKYGRDKHVLISLGGAGNPIPIGTTPQTLHSKLVKLIDEFGFTGVDFDLEGTQIQDGTMAQVVTPCARMLKGDGYFLTTAPEAATIVFDYMEEISRIVDIFQPQYYNNAPNGIDGEYIPLLDVEGVQPAYPTYQYDDTPEGYHRKIVNKIIEPWWMAVAEQCATKEVFNIKAPNVGMLMPASTDAASSQNDWDITALASQVKNIGVVRSVGTWSIEYDKVRVPAWNFAISMGAIVD